MNALKSVVKKSNKQEREHKVLLGLIEHFLQTGRPVGSNTLKDLGFDTLSSATIRNYFANLEQTGYLTQQHASADGSRQQKPIASMPMNILTPH